MCQESMCPFVCVVTMAYNVYVFIPLATTALGVVFLFLILLTTSAFTGHAGAHKVSIINDLQLIKPPKLTQNHVYNGLGNIVVTL